MTWADLDRYSDSVRRLLTPLRSMPLGPAEPNEASRAPLKSLTIEQLLGGRAVRDELMARAAIAGLWLYHDFLDESHRISQEIETAAGSYWHGIMHRREPDYSNAKYWLRRVGRHPVFSALNSHAARIGGGSEWDPMLFVDVCERAAREGGELERTCRDIQMIEWFALFDHCLTCATSRS